MAQKWPAVETGPLLSLRFSLAFTAVPSVAMHMAVEGFLEMDGGVVAGLALVLGWLDCDAALVHLHFSLADAYMSALYRALHRRRQPAHSFANAQCAVACTLFRFAAT